MLGLNRLTTIVTALVLLVAATTTKGDSIAVGLTVTPGRYEASVPLGSTYNVPISVSNTTTTSAHIQVSLSDFTLSQTGDYRFEKTGTSEFSLLRWAAVRPREFDIPPGTVQQVQLTIAMPSNPQLSGEYAGIVFFATRPERHGGGFAFSARVASKFYITVPNTVKTDGAIVKMTSSSTPGHENYRVLFKNLGNTHVYLRGQITIQKNGQVVDQVAMADNLLVERAGTRLIEASGKALPAGTYQAVATIDYGGKTETGGAINFEVR
jgi:hypothetical protein